MTVEDIQHKEADLVEWAWTIICNAGGGNWELETPEWQAAAAKFRTAYHEFLDTYLRER